MIRLLFFAVLFLGISLQANGQQIHSLENILIEYHQLNSQIFQNTRTLRILLPNDYYKEDNDKRYKVLFLNDGQCLFNEDPCQSSEQDWKIDESVDSLLKMNILEPFIVVGIDHIGLSERGNEYLPWEDIFLNPPIPNPEGSKYPDFLVTEVLPFVKDKYRISTQREHIGLGGSSYGALIALYTYLKKPDQIGFLLLESPSFYVNNQAILKKAESFDGDLPLKLYLGIGTNELGFENCNESNEDNLMAVRDVSTLKKMFLSKGLNKNSINVVVDECAVHSVGSWADRFPKAIQFLIND